MVLAGVVLAQTGCTNLRLVFTYQDDARKGCRGEPMPTTHLSRGMGAPHADWGKLRPFRPYTRLGEVGPFEHHVTVKLFCNEDRTVHYAVTRNPKTGALEAVRERGFGKPVDNGFGAMPADQARAIERTVRKRIGKVYKGERRVRVLYRGSYRTVRIDQVVPHDDPGDPSKRTGWYATVTLRTNRELTGLVAPPMRWGSGRSRLCSRYGRNCAEPPRWIDFDTGNAATVTRLAALTYEGSPIPETVRREFLARALETARASEAGKPPTALDSLAVHRRARMALTGLRQTQSIGFDIHTRPINYRATPARTEKLRVELPIRDIVFGKAEASKSVTVDGIEMRTHFLLENKEPPAADASGRVALTVHARITIEDSRGTKREIIGTLEGVFLIDKGAAAGLQLRPPRNAAARDWYRQIRQRFPGTKTLRHIDAYLRIEQQPTRWRPGLSRRR
jgi:hypothetical protein